MWELRWVLLGLGILLIGGVYLWGRGFSGRSRGMDESTEPAPQPSAALDRSFEVPTDPEEAASNDQSAAKPHKESQPTDRIITVRCVAKSDSMGSEQVVLALREAGLKHGRYGIFHRYDDPAENDPLFSVASLTEPGSFDLSHLADKTIPGMSFFMVLPGPGDAVERFDLMVQTARSLAHELDAELHDERGSFWSIQRERYLREEIILYRHQRERS